MPAGQGADRAVLALREWFQKWGGAKPSCLFANGSGQPLAKEQVLDRYTQHTRHCRHCQRALQRVEAACAVTRTLGLLLTSLAAAFTAVALAPGCGWAPPVHGWLRHRLPVVLALSVAAAVAAAVHAWLLHIARPQFYHVPYVHAHQL
ncbi:hypothetical protein V8C86DRAFT_2548233 [Haematococcus lacustris]